jgi:uncharacterized protein YdaU (DUF1376 family)
MSLIVQYWDSGGLTNFSDVDLQRASGMTEREWKQSRHRIQALFTDGWRHERTDEELSRVQTAYATRIENGKLGGRPTRDGTPSSKPKPNGSRLET